MLIKRFATLIAVLALMCSAAFAQGELEGAPTADDDQTPVVVQSPSEGRYRPAADEEAETVSIALAYGVFRPRSAAVRDRFGSSLTRLSLHTYEPTKPSETRLTWEVGGYRSSKASYMGGKNSISLYSAGIGFQRGFGESKSVRPYVVAHAGPYYGKVRVPLETINQSKWGLNLNASLGVIFDRRFYLEARYDYFSKIAGFSFDGFSISGGYRLFDMKF